MAQSIAVAADINRDTIRRQMQSHDACDHKHHGLISSQAQLVASLPSWLRSPSRRNTSDASGSTSPPARRRAATTFALGPKRPRFRSYSLLSKEPRPKEQQLARSNTVAVHSQVARSIMQPSRPERPLSPATPALAASPTSPTTPAFPPTPLKLSYSQPSHPPALYQYGSFAYDGVIYSTPQFSPPSSHFRTSTWSSVGSSYSHAQVAVKLPIGQRGRTSTPEHIAARDPLSYESDDDRDYDYSYDAEYDYDVQSVICEDDEIGDETVRDIQRPELTRPPRVLIGPRSMSRSPPAVSTFEWVAEASSPTEASSVPSVETAPEVEAATARKARRRGIDFMSMSGYSEALSQSPEPSLPNPLDELPEEDLAVGGIDVGEDFSWEAEECGSGDDTSSCMNISTNYRIPSPAPMTTANVRQLDEHDDGRNYGADLAQSLAAAPAESSHALAEPFESLYDEPREVSAFDSDSEDEDHPSAWRRPGFKLGGLRKAMRDSMSLPSLRSRLSVVLPDNHSSPESVSSLRARQTTTSSSPGRNPYITKLASDFALSPIPASPSEPTFVIRSHSSDSLPLPVAAVASPPSDGTTVRAIWNLLKSKSGAPPLRLPSLPVGKPPDLPLPPTPITDSHVLRPWKEREHVSADQRLTVVDPDSSMALLEMTMSKFEAYAPHAKARSSRPARSRKGSDLSTDRKTLEGTASEAIAPGQGVVVLSVIPPKPKTTCSTSSPTQSPGAGGSKAGTDTFVVPLKDARAASLDGQSVRKERPPSLVLLPKFFFEDDRPVPLRSTSLLQHRVQGSLPIHEHPLSNRASSASPYYAASISSVPTTYGIVDFDTPSRPSTPPRHSEEGLTSFMNFSPRQPEPYSRVRRLLSRVNMRGLRASSTT